ncbi:TMV resistance protein N-like [Dorcoceras hygrometricum]|uniref:TMV resistance protein N-like n=1 Tax=Dorcoceras hygrometricum TaxID=472368 RepID=A0A2Z7DEZ0_9LAMI|nr:TMV resistance protein N-like [Dorcoceras hygrometricum]
MDQTGQIWTTLTTLDVETRSEQSQAGQGKTSSELSGMLFKDKPAKSQQGDEGRELPARLYKHPGTLNSAIKRHGYKRSETTCNRCVYAVQHNATGNKTIYTASQNSKHKHISMPNLNAVTSSHPYLESLCNNYYKLGPSNADLTPAKPITNNYSRIETQESNSWELRTRPTLYYPFNSAKSSKQTQGKLQANVRKQYPNEASQLEESNATTLTSIGAIYRRKSEKIMFGEQYLRSRNRSHSMPKQISTKSNDVAESYYHNWTRHPLLTAEQLNNICSQRNIRSLTQLKANATYS